MDEEHKQSINVCITQIKNGQTDYVSQLHELIGPSLRYIALKYLKNSFDADDMVQDFWADIVRIASKCLIVTNGYSFLCKVMTNMTINRIRKINHDRTISIDFVDYSQLDNDDDCFKKTETRILVDQAMLCLDEKEKIVIQLAYFEDKNIRQIAKELKCSKSQIGRIKNRAIEKLKAQLDLSDGTNPVDKVLSL